MGWEDGSLLPRRSVAPHLPRVEVQGSRRTRRVLYATPRMAKASSAVQAVEVGAARLQLLREHGRLMDKGGYRLSRLARTPRFLASLSRPILQASRPREMSLIFSCCCHASPLRIRNGVKNKTKKQARLENNSSEDGPHVPCSFKMMSNQNKYFCFKKCSFACCVQRCSGNLIRRQFSCCFRIFSIFDFRVCRVCRPYPALVNPVGLNREFINMRGLSSLHRRLNSIVLVFNQSCAP